MDSAVVRFEQSCRDQGRRDVSIVFNIGLGYRQGQDRIVRDLACAKPPVNPGVGKRRMKCFDRTFEPLADFINSHVVTGHPQRVTDGDHAQAAQNFLV